MVAAAVSTCRDRTTEFRSLSETLKKIGGIVPSVSSQNDLSTSKSPETSNRSEFNKKASRIGLGIHETSMKIARLAKSRRMSSAVFPASVVAGVEPLLAFKDVPSSEKMNLFISKLSLCCMVFDFSDPSKNTTEKDLKRITLIELLDFVASGPPRFSEPAILAMCKMCVVNLFRVFPPNCLSNSHGGENDDDEPMFDPAWTHLQLVYDIFLRFVTCSSVEAKVAKKYINHSFILKLLDLFESDDPRERDCLKAIMHRIYGKFMRYFVITRSPLLGGLEAMRKSEVSYAVEAITTKPENESSWRYLRGLHKDDPKSLINDTEVSSICLKILNAKCNHIFALSLLLDLLAHGYQPTQDLKNVVEEHTSETDPPDSDLAKTACSVLERLDPMRVNYWKWRKSSVSAKLN